MGKYLNLQNYVFEGVGNYEIPQIYPVHDLDVQDWIGFNYAKTTAKHDKTGVHFFLDDYQFERVWNYPERYAEILQKFGAVLTPDFSLYSDFPKIIQIYNHYRKHWLGAYWQLCGLHVIPTIAWSTPDSYEWCFDGEPIGGIVAVSSVGTQKKKESKDLFLRGYDEMIKRLKPEKVLFYGSVPEGLSGDIINIKPYQEKLRNRGVK